MKPSIGLRLVLILLALMAVTWIFEAVMTHSQARAQVAAVFDAQLAQVARLLADTVAHEVREDDLERFQLDLQSHKYSFPIVFQVWSGDNRKLLASPDAPISRIPYPGEDYADVSIDGEDWRVLGLELGTGMHVVVAQQVAARNALIAQISGEVIEPLGLSMALAIVLIWFGVQGGLAPLRHLASEIAGRNEQSLAPLPAANYPVEIRAVVDELNSMFSRLEAALERNGRFTADAAHELRTPLAGLRIQAQAAQRAGDEATRQHALQQLMVGVDRTDHIIDQLLTLSRIDPERERAGFSSVDLRALASDTVDEYQSRSGGLGVTLAFSGKGEAVFVRGNSELLRIMCRNLVDNAVRYTPRGGEVGVDILAATGRVELVVEDTGPGIPPDQRAAVLERFHRLPGTEVSGSGLGLAIVETIAAVHEAHLELSDREGGPGLRVSVSIPAAA
ncbi:MAG: ATP-binding protein [Thiohalobacterales bacterium]|nr:ATP-binding protein [Thiohalobacterales bacterium]